jgi:hypothetical protein
MRLTRDEENFRHVPVEAPTPRRPKASSQAATTDAERVLKALARLAGENKHVTSTGASSLFQIAPPELEGMSRRAIEAATQSLEDQRLVVSGARGRLMIVRRS